MTGIFAMTSKGLVSREYKAKSTESFFFLEGGGGGEEDRWSLTCSLKNLL